MASLRRMGLAQHMPLSERFDGTGPGCRLASISGDFCTSCALGQVGGRARRRDQGDRNCDQRDQRDHAEQR